MSSADILDKVRKLCALASSASVHEAAAAAAAAARLLLEHNLSESELTAETDPDESPVTEALDGGGAQHVSWKSVLAGQLESANSCAGFVRRVRRGAHWVVVSMVVGRPQDVATVKYLYAWLTHEIVRLCNESGVRGRTGRNSFCHGAVAGVAEAMHSATKAVRDVAESTPSGSLALVRVDGRLTRAKGALPEGLRTSPVSSSRFDRAAHAAGRRAGASIHTGAKLGQGGTRLLGSGS